MSKRLDELDTPLRGLKVIERKPIRDERGFLERLFCAAELEDVLHNKTIAQINHTLTAQRGVVRGMHYQRRPHAEIKFVTCIRGRVLDVAVDIRTGSPTFLRWHAEELSADNFRTLAIPEGFAHGFQTLSDDCELIYFHTAPYVADAEAAINPEDPRLGIIWPLTITAMSPRDAAHPILGAEFEGVAE